MTTFGTLKEDSFLVEIFPDRRVPLLSVHPVPGSGEMPDCYLLDGDELSAEQFWNVVRAVAKKFDRDPNEVKARMPLGLPLACDHFESRETDSYAQAHPDWECEPPF